MVGLSRRVLGSPFVRLLLGSPILEPVLKAGLLAGHTQASSGMNTNVDAGYLMSHLLCKLPLNDARRLLVLGKFVFQDLDMFLV